jgi:hypothetical protein
MITPRVYECTETAPVCKILNIFRFRFVYIHLLRELFHDSEIALYAIIRPSLAEGESFFRRHCIDLKGQFLGFIISHIV